MSTSDLLLVGIVLFVLIEFLIASTLDYLNERAKGEPLSAVGGEIYNPDEYAKSMAYGSAKYRFESLTGVITLAVGISAITLGWFAWLDEQLRVRLSNELLITVLFIGILILVVTVANMPTSFYATFVIEEKFGFNLSLIHI